MVRHRRSGAGQDRQRAAGAGDPRRRPARRRAASRSSSGSARPARCRSSSSPRAATRSTASSASSSAPTTTSPSRSRRASWWRGCAACCAAPPARAASGRPAAARRRDAPARRLRAHRRRRRPDADPLLRPPARALALRVRPAEDARLAAGPRVLARCAARAGLGQRHREHGPHRRRPRQDGARQDEGDRARRGADPHATAAAATRSPRTCPPTMQPRHRSTAHERRSPVRSLLLSPPRPTLLLDRGLRQGRATPRRASSPSCRSSGTSSTPSSRPR